MRNIPHLQLTIAAQHSRRMKKGVSWSGHQLLFSPIKTVTAYSSENNVADESFFNISILLLQRIFPSTGRELCKKAEDVVSFRGCHLHKFSNFALS